MKGWRSVEELTGWGFAHAPVVMANEAHNGLARCIRTREMGVRVIRAAHAGEVHYDGNGTFGEDLDVAFRLLDAPRFKAELKHASVPLSRSGILRRVRGKESPL
jgi:hypothetical protein